MCLSIYLFCLSIYLFYLPFLPYLSIHSSIHPSKNNKASMVKSGHFDNLDKGYSELLVLFLQLSCIYEIISKCKMQRKKET